MAARDNPATLRKRDTDSISTRPAAQFRRNSPRPRLRLRYKRAVSARAIISFAILIVGCQSPPNEVSRDASPALPIYDAGLPDALPGPCERSWQEESSAWARCMRPVVWDELGMAQIAFQQTESGPCHQCHRAGVGGIFLSEDGQETFARTGELPFLSAHVAAEYDDEECLVGLVASRRLLDKESAPTTFHPYFQWTAERKQALADFFEITHGDYLAGNCD